MGLGAVDLWVGETNTNTEFGLGPWAAERRKLGESWVWVQWTYGSGKHIKALILGWVLEVQ